MTNDADALSTGQLRAAQAKLIMDSLKAAGISLEDLVAMREGGALPGRASFHDYLAKVRPAARAGSVHVYAGYWQLLDEELPGMCACFCEECLAVAGRRAKEGHQVPCPCLAERACACAKAGFRHPAIESCLVTYGGLGHKALADIEGTEIEEAQMWAKQRAMKRWAKRNAKRAAAGRSLYSHSGKSAEEHTRAAASAVLRRALKDGSTGVTRNAATDAPLPRRPKSTARAYSLGQLSELWDVIWSCGLADPELAALLVWWHIETGSRRGAALGLCLDALDIVNQKVPLTEKGDNTEWQPVSVELLRSLIGHALERGDVVFWAVAGLAPASVTVDDVVAGRAVVRGEAPVFYYRRSLKVTDEEGRPVRQ